MNSDQPENHMSSSTKSIIIVVVIALLAIGTYLLVPKESANSPVANDSSESSTPSSTSSAADATTYKDGTYEASGSYSTPGGQESVDVKLTLTNGAVSDIETTGSARGGTSKEYQSEFLSNYKTSVVGKPISEISLSRVAGSSLTSNGFNDALDGIKNDARS